MNQYDPYSMTTDEKRRQLMEMYNLQFNPQPMQPPKPPRMAALPAGATMATPPAIAFARGPSQMPRQQQAQEMPMGGGMDVPETTQLQQQPSPILNSVAMAMTDLQGFSPDGSASSNVARYIKSGENMKVLNDRRSDIESAYGLLSQMFQKDPSVTLGSSGLNFEEAFNRFVADRTIMAMQSGRMDLLNYDMLVKAFGSWVDGYRRAQDIKYRQKQIELRDADRFRMAQRSFAGQAGGSPSVRTLNTSSPLPATGRMAPIRYPSIGGMK